MKKQHLLFFIIFIVSLSLGAMQSDKQRCSKITVKQEFKPTVLFQPKKLAVLLGEKIYNEHYKDFIPSSFHVLQKLPDAAALYIARNTDDQGNTLLHRMAIAGNEAAVRYLLSIGVKPAVENKTRETPVFLAAKYGHLNAFKMIFNAGGNIFTPMIPLVF